MNIAILDFEHYQYLKTLIDLFNVGGNKIHVFTSDKTEKNIKSFLTADELKNVVFYSKINELFTEYSTRMKEKTKHLPEVDLFFINPFYPYTRYDGTVKHYYQFIKSIKAKKRLLSISNLHTWYKPSISRPGHLTNFIYRKKILRLINTLVLVNEMETYAKEVLKIKKPIINIPFTYYKPFEKTETRETPLNIVVPGEVSLERRDYHTLIDAIELYTQKNTNFKIQFLGSINQGYLNTKKLVSRIDTLNQQIGKEIIKLFKDGIQVEKFEEQMRSADFIISPLVLGIKVFETEEVYGTSKFSGATFDIITYRVPGIFPQYLVTDPEFSYGIKKYKNAEHLASLIEKMVEDINYLNAMKEKATFVSEKCRLEKWRAKIFSALAI
ncbi:MAG: hypothetical protein ACK4K0_02795 [Flavobacteriales bacterium]